MTRTLAAAAVLAFLAGPASAQSLFLVPSDPPIGLDGTPDTASALREASLLFHEPPQPREFRKHDIITIIVDESIKASSSQSLETENKTKRSAEVSALVNLAQLLELQLVDGTTNLDLIDMKTKSDFEGEGEYDRQDRFSTRITATVLEVKPNGTLVLEATKLIKKDDEIQRVVVAGLARPQDITDRNTVLSSQLAGLTVVMENEGQVRDAARKGLITRVLDVLFAF